jgi:hypothetical protein
MADNCRQIPQISTAMTIAANSFNFTDYLTTTRAADSSAKYAG